MAKEWAGIIVGIAGALVVTGLSLKYPWAGDVFLYVGLVIFGAILLYSAVALLAPVASRIGRRLVVSHRMKKEPSDWVPLDQGAQWLAANAGPLLRRRLSEPLAENPIHYCRALIVSRIDCGDVTARGTRPDRPTQEVIPHDMGFRVDPEKPNSVLSMRYGTVELAYEDVLVPKEAVFRLRRIAEGLHAHYRNMPVPAIQMTLCYKPGLSDATINAPSGARFTACVEPAVNSSSATSTGAAGGIGFEFEGSPRPKLRDVNADGFPTGYRFKDSPDADLDRVRADRQKLGKDGPKQGDDN